MKYISLDLTSAFACIPRPIDIAVLEDGRLSFHQMAWPAADIVTRRDNDALFGLICRAAKFKVDEAFKLALDGPQGLAEPGQTMRACERALGTNGHTPDQLPPPQEGGGVHMGGYLRSSLDLFFALSEVAGLTLCGLDPNVTLAANLFEIFPGSEWTVLAGRRLDNKTTRQGRLQRQTLLQAAGVQFPPMPDVVTADQNDAAVGAYLLQCSHELASHDRLVGVSPRHDGVNIREGLILHAAHSVAFALPTDKSAGHAELQPEPVPPANLDATPDWAGDGTATVLFIDNSLVWRCESENQWLRPEHDYVLMGIGPKARVRFRLTLSRTTDGPAWRVKPTIQKLLRELGFTPALHLKKALAIAVPVVVESTTQADTFCPTP